MQLGCIPASLLFIRTRLARTQLPRFNSLYSRGPQHSKYHPAGSRYRRPSIPISKDASTASAHRPFVKPPARLTPMSVDNPNSNPVFAAIPMQLSTPDRILSAHTSLRAAQSKAYIRCSMMSKRRRAYTLEYWCTYTTKEELGGYSSVCSIKATGMGVVIITWEFQRLKNVLAMKDAVDAVGECEYTDSSLYVRTTRPLGRFLLKDFTRGIH